MYAELWRTYYAVIVVASGGAIAYFGVQSGHQLFAFGIVVLTIAATAILFARTFRRPR